MLGQKPKIDKQKMITESAPDVKMILHCLKWCKEHMPVEDMAQYGPLIEKNIPKFERYVSILEAK